MTWLQLTLDIPPDQVDCVEDLLLLSGSPAVTLLDGANQALYEPPKGTTPLWQRTLVRGLFSANIDTHALLEQITHAWHEIMPEHEFPSYTLEILEDKDWEREWITHFKPIHFGNQLWICPSWKPTPDPQATNLMLDPGLAFGTGTHPTTALCLEWIAQQSWQHNTVMDYGCGSGILALACLLLHSPHAYCVDNDDQALQATSNNALNNHIQPDKITTLAPHQVPNIQVNTVIANILAGPLIQLAPTLAALTKPQGRLVLSGILAEQAQEVASAYQTSFDITNIAHKDGWVRIEGLRLV